MEDANQPRAAGEYYQIRVRGRLDPLWTDWFEGLTITHETNGDTTLSGRVADQAMLYGLISRACDLGLTLLAVTWVEKGNNHGPA